MKYNNKMSSNTNEFPNSPNTPNSPNATHKPSINTNDLSSAKPQANQGHQAARTPQTRLKAPSAATHNRATHGTIGASPINGNANKITNDQDTNTELSNASDSRIQELTAQVVRLVAEMENLKKRHKKELDEMSKYATSKIMSDLSVPLEQCFMALNVQIPEDIQNNITVKNILQGIGMIKSSFQALLEQYGLKRIYPLNEKFNPTYHQATSQIEDPNCESGAIVNVIQAGYELNGRILKPAMVVVCK